MAELTIGEARNNFSALIADLMSSKAHEYVIKKRNVPVARIVAIDKKESGSRPFGLFRDDPLLVDDGLFDSLDIEIAEEFGV